MITHARIDKLHVSVVNGLCNLCSIVYFSSVVAGYYFLISVLVCKQYIWVRHGSEATAGLMRAFISPGPDG